MDITLSSPFQFQFHSKKVCIYSLLSSQRHFHSHCSTGALFHSDQKSTIKYLTMKNELFFIYEIFCCCFTNICLAVIKTFVTQFFTYLAQNSLKWSGIFYIEGFAFIFSSLRKRNWKKEFFFNSNKNKLKITFGAGNQFFVLIQF